MWEDDEDDDDFDPEDPELLREAEEEENRVKNLPIVKKAEEIFNLVNAIVETIDSENDIVDEDGNIIPKVFFEHSQQMMLEDSMIINAKIHGAEGGDLYTLRMENATIIKVHARSLLTQTSSLKFMGYPNHDYLQLLRDEIENFRIIFVDWINTFDKTNDIPDGWGLFYDPDIDYPEI